MSGIATGSDLRGTGRGSDDLIAARCFAYAAWSELTASPHDFDPRGPLGEKAPALSGLPFDSGLSVLLDEVVEADLERLKFEYSSLFEVGNDGPPAPIREDLQTGQRSGTREDLVRFYDFFGYRLGESYAWAPDHLSVELEFMHYLCFRERAAEQNLRSFQLAQRDFAERHLVSWVPALVGQTAGLAGEGVYARIIGELDRFLVSDLAWQQRTIDAVDES